MPRVTDAHRRARRDEIATAALRVLDRKGVANTSIAGIVEESGLSAGAIYANFENKAELAAYLAQRLFDWRIELLESPAESNPSPVDILRVVLGTMADEAPPVGVILQFWGEATIDDELRGMLAAKIGELRRAFERELGPWAEARGGGPDLVHRASATMVAVCQGYLANAAVLGWISPAEYLSTAEELFAPSPVVHT